MNRKSIMRRNRKEIMKLGKIIETEVLKRDDDGMVYPKKEWGYCIRAEVNGWKISAPDRNWYGAYQGCLEAARCAVNIPRQSKDKG